MMKSHGDASETGQKFDSGKPPLSLLDRYALEQIAQGLSFGAAKYGVNNWRGGIRHSRLLDAALRHLMAIADGEDVDNESGLPHAALLGCNVMFLIWMQAARPDLDDRWRPNPPPQSPPDAPSQELA